MNSALVGNASVQELPPEQSLKADHQRYNLHEPVTSLPRRIRILIVESQPVFREGLNTIISAQSDMVIVAQAATSKDAISAFRFHHLDIAIVDQGLPEISGTDALIAIRAEFPVARIIILGIADGDLVIQRALRAGAVAYLLKNTPSNDDLVQYLRTDALAEAISH